MSKTSKELGVSSSISRMPKPKDLFEFPQNCPLSWVPLLQKIPPAGCQKNRDVFVKIDNVKPRHVATHVMQLWTFSRKKHPQNIFSSSQAELMTMWTFLRTVLPHFLLKFLGLAQKKGKFLLIGLDNAGKTTLLELLKTGKFSANAPTLHGTK